MGDAIQLENVNKQFKGFELSGLNLTVKRGFITGFIGPNGAGKTSTIKLIMNLMHKDSGRIELFGLDHESHEKEIKNRIGFVYAENHFYDHLTVEKTKEVLAPFYDNWDDALFYSYIETLNLPLNRKIKHLSSGMKIKFSLTLALSHHADLIIMDEPTSGLDPVIRSEVLDILYEVIQDEEKTIFFSSHITTDLEQIADYIVFIDEGNIVFHQSKEEILDHYAIVRGENDLLDGDTRRLFEGIRRTEFGFEGLTADKEQAAKLFEDKALIEPASLEQIMVYMIRREK